MENLLLGANFLLLIIIPFVAKNYFSSYFAEKAKNFATKQDIQELTLKQEASKSFVSSKMGAFNKQNECFIEYYNELIELLMLLDVRLGDLLIEDLFNHQAAIRETLNEAIRAYYRLFVYTDDTPELLNAALELSEIMGNIHKAHYQHFSGVKLAMLSEDAAYTGDFEMLKEKAKETDKLAREMNKKLFPLRKKLFSALNAYVRLLNKQLNHKIDEHALENAFARIPK